MTTTFLQLPVSVETAGPVCEQCGQPLQPAPQLVQVHPSTIGDIYDVWPTRPSGKRIGPNVLVIELKVQR
jgi:hypothetical protein